MQNVLDFGAKGDGKTLDTAAIQAAIDAGGEVYFPEGTYLSGTLYLKSGGGLNLAAGAVLRASHDRCRLQCRRFLRAEFDLRTGNRHRRTLDCCGRERKHLPQG